MKTDTNKKLVDLHNDWSDIPLKSDKRYIYHYTSRSGLDGILESHNLWANDIYRQNDKSEGVYTLGILKDNINMLFHKQVNKNMILETIEKLSPKLNDRFYFHNKYRPFIISFSTKKMN